MIGEDIRNEAYRNTAEFYRTFPQDSVAPQLIRFVLKHAGKNILDIGCATGNYCLRLNSLGYQTKGVDINQEYVLIAKERGVDADGVEALSTMADKSTDTILLFEVIEHLDHPDDILESIKRLARKNILIATPNSNDVAELRRHGLIYEHFGDLDHKNFFTKATLTALLERHFSDVHVYEGDPLNPLALAPTRLIRFIGKALSKMGVFKSPFHFRLFAICRP